MTVRDLPSIGDVVVETEALFAEQPVRVSSETKVAVLANFINPSLMM